MSGYLRWHLLDHMPEQYQLPGILHGTRWMADDDCRDARVAGSGKLAEVGSIVNYLVTEPVQPTHDDFMELGPRLALMGRFPERRPSLLLSMPASSPLVLVPSCPDLGGGGSLPAASRRRRGGRGASRCRIRRRHGAVAIVASRRALPRADGRSRRRRSLDVRLHPPVAFAPGLPARPPLRDGRVPR